MAELLEFHSMTDHGGPPESMCMAARLAASQHSGLGALTPKTIPSGLPVRRAPQGSRARQPAHRACYAESSSRPHRANGWAAGDRLAGVERVVKVAEGRTPLQA